MDNLVNNLEHRMADRSHTELFSLLPSVCLSKPFDIDLTVDKLIKNLGDDLQCINPKILRSELKRWETEMETRKKRKVEVISKSKHFRVDRKASYSVKDPPDSFLESLEFADIDCYPNTQDLIWT